MADLSESMWNLALQLLTTYLHYYNAYGHQTSQNDDEISIEEIFDPVVEKLSRSAIESALDDLKDAAMFSDEGVQMKRLILSFERLYENERLKCLKQRDITDFFTPV